MSETEQILETQELSSISIRNQKQGLLRPNDRHDWQAVRDIQEIST